MESMHPFDRAADAVQPTRYYIWQDEPGMFSVPLAGWHYEPSADDPRIFEPVRRLTKEEIAAQEAERAAARKPRKRAASEGPAVRTALYRLHDSEGQLLYLGISVDPLRRWPEHAADKPWWPSVANFTTEWFGTRTAALEAEAEAIRRERPLHNIVHNGTTVS